MLRPDVNEIAKLLKEESDRNGGTLPELYRIAWDAYLMALVADVFDHNDYIDLRHHFPTFDDDPDANDPVNAITIGKHYKDNYYGIAEGEFVDETEFEGLYRKIRQDAKHFGGQLPPPYTVAWSGKLLGLHDCKEITDSEYEQLKAMLPVLEDNPVKRVEEFTRRYVSS
jgi:hypothetical protein